MNVAFADSQFCLAYPLAYEIRCFALPFELKRVIRVRQPLTPTPKGAAEKYRQAYIDRLVTLNVDPVNRAAQQALLDASVYADTLPAFDWMLIDRTNHIWLREFSVDDVIESGFGNWHANMGPPAGPEPHRWRILSPTGVWLGDLMLPARFTPLDVGADYVLGLAKDDDDVESIVIYRLER